MCQHFDYNSHKQKSPLGSENRKTSLQVLEFDPPFREWNYQSTTVSMKAFSDH